MKKFFLLWTIATACLVMLSSCNYKTQEKGEEHPNQVQTTAVYVDESENSKEPKKKTTASYVLQESDIAQFQAVPDWDPEEFEEQMDRGFTVPQFLINAYEESGLDGNSMKLRLPNEKTIAELYRDKNGQYHFSGSFSGETALFRNENESITVLTRSFIERKFIGHSYYNDGNNNLKIVHMDYKDGTDVKLVDYADDFSIVYYPATNEMVCMRYGKEIGPRTKNDANLLMPGSFGYEWKDGTMRYDDGFKILTNGFINEGRLIYPILLKNGDGVSFHLYVAAVLDENVNETGTTKIEGTTYGIYQGRVYTIQNVTKQQGNRRGHRLVVEDTEIHLQVQEMESASQPQVTDELLQDQEEKMQQEELQQEQEMEKPFEE